MHQGLCFPNDKIIFSCEDITEKRKEDARKGSLVKDVPANFDILVHVHNLEIMSDFLKHDASKMFTFTSYHCNEHQTMDLRIFSILRLVSTRHTDFV